MSGICEDRAAHAWAALSSENERLAPTADYSTGAAGPAGSVPARWAELASHRERLVAAAPLLGGLASSPQAESGLRLVVPAA
jgi:hypothetical protein